jgi:hypothetical protein
VELQFLARFNSFGETLGFSMWTLILTGRDFVPVGQITNASDLTINLGLNKATDTLSFKIRMDHYLSSTIASVVGYVKAYENKVLKFFGPIISAEEQGDSTSAYVTVNAVSPGWFFNKRLVGLSASGTLFNTLLDKAVITENLIEEVNSRGDMHIATSLSAGSLPLVFRNQFVQTPSASSAATYTAGPYVPLANSVTELSVGNDGFDWLIMPVDNYNTATGSVLSNKISYFLARPVIGTQRPNAVFEYGGGLNNVAAYSRSVTRDTQANTVFNFTSNGPDVPAYPTVVATSNVSINLWDKMEDIASADILDQGLRQTLVNEHITFRADPRVTMTFDPHIDPQKTGRLPVYGEDYALGDFVRCRSTIMIPTQDSTSTKRQKLVRFDNYFRVWGVSISVDNNGLSRTSITVTDDGS